MGAENSDDQEPREMPSKPEDVDWIRCLSCGEQVRPVLAPEPDLDLSEDEYDEAVPCRFACPACGENMSKEMRSFDEQMYEVTHTSYHRVDVDAEYFEN